MQHEFVIKKITHSGRKGIRYTDVLESKYDGLAGCHIMFDTDKVIDFTPLEWKLIGHKDYDWWTTSEVIGVGITHEHTMLVETINTIYELEEII